MSRDLDIRLLRAFEAVVRLGSGTRAAALLNRSPPAISQQIRKLEEMVGHALFACERSWKMTREGEILYASAQHILNINDQTLSDLCDTHSIDPLKLGVPEEFAAQHLSSAIDRFKSVWPQVPIDIEVNLSRNLLTQLHEGALDLILAKQPCVRARQSDALWDESLIWVAANDFATDPDGPVPLVVFTDACIYRRTAINRLTQADRRWTIAATCTSWTGIRASVLAGVGVSIVSTNFPMQGLRVIANDEALPPLPAVSVLLMRGPQSHTPAGDFLATVLRETARHGYGDRDGHCSAPSRPASEQRSTMN